MPDTVHIPILALAPVTFMPAKGKSPKTTVVEFTVDVLVPSIGLSDAPVVLASRDAGGRATCRSFDGRLWMTETVSETSVEAFREMVGVNTYFRAGLLGRADEIPSGAGKGGVPAGARIIDDGRPAAEARMREMAKCVGFLGGRLWIAGPAPALKIVTYRAGEPTVEIARVGHGAERCYGFSPDREADLREFVRACNFPGGFKIMPRPLGLEIDASVHWAYPELRANSHVAMREAITAVSHSLADHPTPIIAHLARLGEVRDACLTATDHSLLAAEADAALASVEETRQPFRGLHILGHAIRIGREAIARSVEASDADLESLSALA